MSQKGVAEGGGMGEEGGVWLGIATLMVSVVFPDQALVFVRVLDKITHQLLLFSNVGENANFFRLIYIVKYRLERCWQNDFF